MSITDDVKKQLKEDLDDLKQMRDEIRVKLHLAGQEARDKWRQLEPRLEELELKFEKGGKQLGDATSTLFAEVGQAVREFGARLLGKDDNKDDNKDDDKDKK